MNTLIEHADLAERADQSGSREFRIFGPPGTGKTTTTARWVERSVERFGPSSILVTSFSRTAAAELNKRELPIPADRIGTIHAHCYRALGSPTIAESKVDDWNAENPNLAITPSRNATEDHIMAGLDDAAGGRSPGDECLEELNRLRGMRAPRAMWPAMLREFEARWTWYKSELGLLDFTDLIETALHDLPVAPGDPAVIFADEAQDLNKMQLSLIRKWGERAQYFALAGDDDQLLYAWTGCTPEALLDPSIPRDQVIILSQSYRVPRAVHAEANALIQRVSRRQEKEYRPRDVDGQVVRLSFGHWQHPEDAVMRILDAHPDRKVMFLTSCQYMLNPLIAILRKRGVPFWNPYRRIAAAWNPLRIGKGSSSNRVLSLIAAHPSATPARPWTYRDLTLWTEWLQSKGILRHGAKKRIEGFEPTASVELSDLDATFEPAALEELLAAFEGSRQDLLEWWASRLTASTQKRAEFPARVAAAYGADGLITPPRVIVGTIHSVKGGEADVVVVWPDLSRAADAAYQRQGLLRDSVIRTYYVGLTRARETVYICPPAGPAAIRL